MQYGVAISPFYVLLGAVGIRFARANRNESLEKTRKIRKSRKKKKKERVLSQLSICRTRLVMREIFRAAMLR